ncbi:MAG: putative phosphoserine phosphatase / 1-acylglycerol-3-phosphate O-acyltransferase [Actinomycetota bacterium]|nr:putative phosphoserine phosphatase / 1-acylglycerol-3-phosphate O-acyltransferase [Actinomycetota bacterium]
MTNDDLSQSFVRPAVTPSMVLRTSGAYAALGTGLLIGAGVGILGRSRRTGMNTAMSVALPAFLAVSDIRLDVWGEENLWRRRPAIFLINHQSELDLIVVSSLVQRDMTGVVKRELRVNPLAAAMGWLGEFAFVDRSSTSNAIHALEPVVEALRQGRSLGIAAEGHRSDSPMPGPFKVGAFHMAIEAQVPIVPVVIRNTGDLLPPGARFVAPGTVQVAVLDPIEPEGLTRESVHERADALREEFIATLVQWPSAEQAD